MVRKNLTCRDPRLKHEFRDDVEHIYLFTNFNEQQNSMYDALRINPIVQHSRDTKQFWVHFNRTSNSHCWRQSPSASFLDTLLKRCVQNKQTSPLIFAMTPCYPRRTTARRQETKTLHYSFHSSFSSFFLLTGAKTFWTRNYCMFFSSRDIHKEHLWKKNTLHLKDMSHAREDFRKHKASHQYKWPRP